METLSWLRAAGNDVIRPEEGGWVGEELTRSSPTQPPSSSLT